MKKDKSIIYAIVALVVLIGILAMPIKQRRDSVIKAPSTVTEQVITDKPVAKKETPNIIKMAAEQSAKKGEIVKLSFSEFMNAAKDKKLSTVVLKKTEATGKTVDGNAYRATIVYDAELLSKLSDMGVDVSVDDSMSVLEVIGGALPLIFGVLLLFWLFRGMRGSAGGGIGGMIGRRVMAVSQVKGKVTFKDVAGIDEAKHEVEELVEFLRNPARFSRLGGRSPRGVLMYGAPGTGKTLLARAIAGEADVPFFTASGSDFSGILVGLGVSRVKELFETAKKHAPCIVFIDEIDAIGQHRGKGIMPSDQDREQTLNQLLIEMDGFEANSGVIIIGATNRPDVLDAALMRPGRFDRSVYIDLPDVRGRLEILELYAKKVTMDNDVDLSVVARATPGFSGAELENLLNEAALLAVRANHVSIMQDDIEEAKDKIMMGPKKGKKMSQNDIKLTAYHEAGHAFVSVHYADITDPIHKATIIPRGRALGMVQRLPIDDKVSMTLAEIRADLSIAVSGRVAEELFFGPDKITTGAAGDIQSATSMARRAVTLAGLSKKVGMVAVSETEVPWGQVRPLENVSDKTAELVDAEVRRMIDEAYTDSKKIITKNKARVKAIADALIQYETLDKDEIEALAKGKTIKRKEVKPLPRETSSVPVSKSVSKKSRK